MRKLSSLKYHAVHFPLAYLFLTALISLTLGSFDTVTESKCEYEDANLIWRNVSAYSLHDVKAMAWYKGKGSLIATWLEGKGFVEYPPYIGRLMQIGETGIKIRTANRSDSGIYWLSLTLSSVDHKLEAVTHLEVKVAPSSQCKPKITLDESFMKADLPVEGCGTPRLIPKWQHANRTVIQELQNSSSFLDLRTNRQPEEYVVCAEGESAKCYKGNISDLCERLTNDVRQLPSVHGSIPGVGYLAFVILLIIAVVFPAVVVVLRRHGFSGRKPGGRNEEKSKDSEKFLLEIQNHLRKLYENLMTVPLSPTGEEDFINVSELYVNIEFRKVEFADLNNGESNASSDSPCDCQPLISKDQTATEQNNQSGPILIFGDCGSGKSVWCKHLVKCWLQNSDNNDTNIQGLHLPDLGNIHILLYLPLKFSDRGVSFEKLVTRHLLNEKTTYLDFLMKYAKDHAQCVLIVMDGLDIITENVKLISELLDHKPLSSCTIIVTSRPTSLKPLQDTCHVKIEQLRLFRVSEMTLEGSKAYASKLLERINRLHCKNLQSENFWTFTEHFQLQSLLKVPYLCLLLLHVWMKNKNLYFEVTDVLFDIIYYYLRRASTNCHFKERIEKAYGRKYVDVTKYITKLNKWPLLIEYSDLLYVLSGVAADILSSKIERKTNELKVPKIFSITHKDGHDLQVICETGLLTETLLLSTKEKVSDVSFFDRSICECFVSTFIALQQGKECDFIVSSGNAILQNSMIIHMLFQLSPTAWKDIMVKARKSLEKESTNTMGNERRDDSNEKFRYSVTEKLMRSNRPVMWLQSLMYNNKLDEKKLLFLTTALHFAHTLTSLELENHENNDKLVFWLPMVSTLESLTLDINNCTLLLCKEWHYKILPRLKEVVIKSVHINTSTLKLLTKVWGFCADLEMLEISPAKDYTDNNDVLSERSDLTTFSWMQLSERIQKSGKLKTLKLSNLNLVGEVDTLLSRLNHYNNLETLVLSNLSNILQEKSPLTDSLGTAIDKDNDNKPLDKINLQRLELEELSLRYSPMTFMFCMTKEGTAKMVKNNLKVFCMSTVDMDEKSWQQLGNQIGALTLSEVHLENVHPKRSVQNLLDGIGKCENVERLSLIDMDTGYATPSFCFLKNMKKLSSLHLEWMQIARLSSRTLFEGISECKKLKTLFFGNIDIDEVPDNLCFGLNNLTKLTVCKVRISEISSSLYSLLNAFRDCKNLETLSLRNVNTNDIPLKLSARKTLKIYIE